MKKWLIITGLLLLLLAGGFFAAIKLVMPKAAIHFIPVKWQNIPLGEKRIIVHQYLDQPDSSFGATDLWKHKLNNSKYYQLGINYNADSTAVKYIISYEVIVLGYRNTTQVKSDSLR